MSTYIAKCKSFCYSVFIIILTIFTDIDDAACVLVKIRAIIKCSVVFKCNKYTFDAI